MVLPNKLRRKCTFCSDYVNWQHFFQSEKCDIVASYTSCRDF